MTADEVGAYVRWWRNKYPFTNCIIHPDYVNEWRHESVQSELNFFLPALIQLSKTLNKNINHEQRH